MKPKRNEQRKPALRVVSEDELRAVAGGRTETNREKLEAAELRMSNDAVFAFVDGFLKTAPAGPL